MGSYGISLFVILEIIGTWCDMTSTSKQTSQSSNHGHNILCFRFHKDGNCNWTFSDSGGGSPTYLNGVKCVPNVVYSLKTKDIIGVATSDQESVREGDDITFVYEIMSPTSILENCRKFGVEESISQADFLHVHKIFDA